MSVLRNIVTARAGLAVALIAAPTIALQAQVVAPGTNPQAPTTNPAPTPNPKTTPTTVSETVAQEIRNDLPFLQEAASANMLEIRLGQLAQTKASNPAVKQFGQRMVTDHGRLQQELGSLTSRNKVALTATLNSDHAEQLSHLQTLSGTQFDQDYMSLMIQDHQTDVANFENQSRNADSPQVRDLAARSLPILQQHLDLARQVGAQVNVQVATPTSPGQNGQVTYPTTQNGQVNNQGAQRGRNNDAKLRADSKFIHEVTADNLLEVSMARLAERKAQNSDVKQLAQQIAADHDRMQNDWVDLASRNGDRFNPGMGKLHREKLIRLEKLSGRAFDRAYVTTVAQDHRDYISYFENEGRSANSNQVRQLVQRDLSTLRTHFNQAKRAGNQVGVQTAALERNDRGASK
jgi:putative membrane protein